MEAERRNSEFGMLAYHSKTENGDGSNLSSREVAGCIQFGSKRRGDLMRVILKWTSASDLAEIQPDKLEPSPFLREGCRAGASFDPC